MASDDEAQKKQAIYQYLISGVSIRGHWIPETEALIKNGLPEAPVEIPQACDKCQESGSLRWAGTECIEGMLDMYHLIHTELRHDFHCASCGADYAIFQIK